ncbi:hypothetical protein E1K68_01565 [Pseudomonas sp. B2021]|nr:hypothetical protein [Pseudomonas sp. B2021]
MPAMQAPRLFSQTEAMLSQASQLPHKPAPTFFTAFQVYWAPLTAPALDITKLRNCSTVIFWPLKVTSLLA